MLILGQKEGGFVNLEMVLKYEKCLKML